MRVALIGLETMGAGMAARLGASGHDVVMHGRPQNHAASGVRIAGTPREAAAGADVVLSLVANDAALIDIAFGPDGIESGLEAGAVHVGLSTVSLDAARTLTREAELRRTGYISAPAFGGNDEAAAGALVAVAAGPRDSVAFARPVLEPLCSPLVVVGEEPALANAVKLSGQLFLAAVLSGLAEALHLAEKNGVPPEGLLEALGAAGMTSPSLARLGGRMSGGDFAPRTSIAELLKDVNLALRSGQDVGVPLGVAGAAREKLVAAKGRGLAESDVAALIEAQRGFSGRDGSRRA